MSMLLSSGCSKNVETARPLPEWAQAMQVEGQLLAQQQPLVRLHNEALGAQEQVDTNFVAWESVYSIFLDAAVPEEAMQSGYVLKTHVSGTDSMCSWTAQKASRRPQLLRLIYSREDGALKGVQIENKAENMFYESAQSLRYAKGDSILIEGMNKLRWQPSNAYRQLIRFMPWSAGVSTCRFKLFKVRAYRSCCRWVEISLADNGCCRFLQYKVQVPSCQQAP